LRAKHLSGVEEGGGEPSSGNTPDKKSLVRYSRFEAKLTHVKNAHPGDHKLSSNVLIYDKIASQKKFATV
jgi:hypothetical protein